MGAKIRQPHILGFIAILLLVCRLRCTEEFEKIESYIHTIDPQGVVIQLLSIITVLLFICSVIITVLFLLGLLLYLCLSAINESQKYNWFCQLEHKVELYFVGIQIAILNVNNWFMVLVCYYFMFCHTNFIKHITYFQNVMNNGSVFIQICISLYCICLFVCCINFIRIMINKLLHIYPSK